MGVDLADQPAVVGHRQGHDANFGAAFPKSARRRGRLAAGGSGDDRGERSYGAAASASPEGTAPQETRIPKAG